MQYFNHEPVASSRSFVVFVGPMLLLNISENRQTCYLPIWTWCPPPCQKKHLEKKLCQGSYGKSQSWGRRSDDNSSCLDPCPVVPPKWRRVTIPTKKGPWELAIDVSGLPGRVGSYLSWGMVKLQTYRGIKQSILRGCFFRIWNWPTYIVVGLKLGNTPYGPWQFEQLGKLVIQDTILRYAIFRQIHMQIINIYVLD